MIEWKNRIVDELIIWLLKIYFVCVCPVFVLSYDGWSNYLEYMPIFVHFNLRANNTSSHAKYVYLYIARSRQYANEHKSSIQKKENKIILFKVHCSYIHAIYISKSQKGILYFIHDIYDKIVEKNIFHRCKWYLFELKTITLNRCNQKEIFNCCCYSNHF